jgi:hypothetical protein
MYIVTLVLNMVKLRKDWLTHALVKQLTVNK